MEIKPIASGSAGNCYLVSDGNTEILIEAGIPIRQIQIACGFKVSRVEACLISHAHGDHVRSAMDIAKLGVDIFTGHGTIEAAGLSGHRIHTVEPFDNIAVGTFTVIPFDIVHDAPDPLGFFLISRSTGERILYATDTSYIKYRFNDITHAMIEANYDWKEMIRNVRDGRVDAQRAARTIKNHMSIETTIKTLKENDTSNLQEVWLMHLSADNSIAEEFRKRVQQETGVPTYIC
jgi:phosphoribosyl 1,2-cyclic phosphodiesterase